MALDDDRLLVIIPCYNESETIGAVLHEVRACLPNADVLVVDDGSTDHTRPVAIAAGARVVTLPFNLGVGGALRTGFRYAIRHGYRVALQIDGDGQHDPATAHTLLAELSGADLVIGARFADEEDDYEVGLVRRLVMRALARSVSRHSDTTLTDVTSGFRAFGPRALSLFAAHYPAEYLGDTVEALLIATRHGLKVRQVGVAMRPRQGGAASQTSARSAIHVLRLVPAFLVPARLKHELPAVEESP
ncbi:glycosyltransferase family 2 protein [Flexivirga caeni]|uniref:Glycosyltransferase family 2 protein n=1 Tax=Flexivirga caeni TaxID=2294115 RepID=A0A3M9MIJ0_9MICO|nr:glycosyltransferase family 2 protein [Flexivirga caeni]RNI25389.1 glycosyltransferase family 2 protein [Flexivirga caeni]